MWVKDDVRVKECDARGGKSKGAASAARDQVVDVAIECDELGENGMMKCV